MDLGIKGKVAIVTGSSRGIGKQTAIALAEEGCHVMLCARNLAVLEKTAEEIRNNPKAREHGVQVHFSKADAAELSDIQNVVDQTLKKWGTVHILVNNVGGTEAVPNLPFEEVSEDIWTGVYKKNALAATRFTNLCLPSMRRQKWGRVITVISRQGREGGGKPWYSMAKAAEMALMKAMAMNFELARDGITFNSIAPGAVLTEEGNWADFLRDDPEGLKKRMQSTVPLGRLGTCREIADVIVFACSEKASLLSGASIPVDGAESRAY